MLAMYLAVLDDRSSEEQFIDVYNTYKRLVYHTAYKIMGDSYLAEDVLQEVFLYVAKNFSKIHRENCHELAAYLVSCSRSRAYDMLRVLCGILWVLKLTRVPSISKNNAFIFLSIPISSLPYYIYNAKSAL